jgi:Tol biopolymer transport system component/DNA-binding winged helix-turn-helix (wHTH) protein
MFEEDFEETKGLFGKRHARAVFSELACAEVQLEIAKARAIGRWMGSGHGDHRARMIAPTSRRVAYNSGVRQSGLMTDRLASTPFVLRFRDIELDVRAGALHRNGQRITLPDQPLRLLTALLERPGELVTRDELRRKLWPADTYVDFEHGLNAAVKRLRDALSDSADAPIFIETVPRRGYRFLAPVERLPVEDVPASNGRVELEAVPTPAPLPASGALPAATAIVRPLARPDRAERILALAFLVLAVVIGWRAVRSISGEQGLTSDVARRSTPREPKRLTFGPSLQTDVTWSPDGRRIAYASDRAGNFDIWVQAVDSSDPVALTNNPEPDTQAAWSPTSDRIVFRSERDGGGLFVVSSNGGPVRRLTSFGMRPAWLPDGRRVMFSGGLDGYMTRLFVVSAEGDQPPHEILADFLKDGDWSAGAAPHPDGRFTIVGIHPAHRYGIFTIGADGRNLVIQRPTGVDWQAPRAVTRLQWDKSGATLYLEVTSTGVPTLWKVPSARDTLDWASSARLTDGISSAVSASISPDGKQLAFTNLRRLTRGWVFPFDDTAGRVEGAGRPVTDDDLAIRGLSASRDGRSLLYMGMRPGDGTFDLFSTNLDSGATSVIARHAHAGGASLSWDGTHIAYLLQRAPSAARDGRRPESSEREYALAVRDLAGSERLVSHWTQLAAMMPSDWTPDGRSVLGTYMEPPYTGTAVVATWPASRVAQKPDRVLLQAPGRRFWQSTFSPDGRWVSFVAEFPDRSTNLEMGVAPAAGASPSGWTRIAGDHAWPDKPRWSRDGRTLFFVSQKPAGYFNVWGVRMDPARGVQVGTAFPVTHFDSPDLMLDPAIDNCEIAVTARHLALTMRSATGSIWALSDVDR